MSEFHTEAKRMSCVEEASTLLRRTAEPRPIGDSVKAAIRRAARRVGLSFGRAEDIWYRQARLVRAEEMDAIRKAAAQRTQEQKARNDYQELMDLLSILEHRLAMVDEEFHRGSIDAQRAATNVARGDSGAVD